MGSSRGRKRSLRSTLARLAASALLALIAAELGLRAVQWVGGTPHSGAAALERMHGVVESITTTMAGAEQAAAPDGASPTVGRGHQLNPYTGFDWPGRDASLAQIAAATASDTDDAIVDVHVFGGSVAQLFCTSSGKRLEELLRERGAFGGRPVRVFSHAWAGFKQPQQLNALSYALALGVQPDIVLDLDGFNDLTLALSNVDSAVHPVSPSITHWGSHAGGARPGTPAFDALVRMRSYQMEAQDCLRRTQRFHLHASALSAAAMQWSVRRVQRRYLAEYDAIGPSLSASQSRGFATGPAIAKDAPELLEVCARIWFESSLSMDAVCDVRGVRFVHCLQPNLHLPGSKPWSDEERVTGAGAGPALVRGVHEGFPRLQELGRTLRERGVEFHDLTAIFAGVTETLYVDQCHLNQAGNELLAQALARVLAGS
jgi:hypothetical protein